jgi:rfaE bifunctional protein kinase chain/domain
LDFMSEITSQDEVRRWLKKIRSLRVLVIGDVMLDHYIWGDAHRISPEAPVPVVHVNRETRVAGGAANVAYNLASLGALPTLCGVWGMDEAGTHLESMLRTAGVRWWLPEGLHPQVETIVKTRVVVRQQQLCRLDWEAATSSYGLLGGEGQKQCWERILADHDAVLFSDYAKGTLTQQLMDMVVPLVHKVGLVCALDPKPRRRLSCHEMDLMTPNRSEALEMSGVEWSGEGDFPAEEVCSRIYNVYRPKQLVITLGEGGMLISKEGKVEEIVPTAAREVYDVSGAGDTVVATLTLALAAGLDLRDAVSLANAAAGVVVGKLGTAVATPGEIEQFVSGQPGSVRS